MAPEILFIAHRVPFPPDRGDKIRSHHVLRALAGIAPVHVACFGDSEADLEQDAALTAIAASHCLVMRRKPLPLAGAEAIVRGHPVSLAAFADGRLVRYVAHVLAHRPIGAIYVFSGQMGRYVPAGFTGRVVMDLVDVDSAKFDAYACTGHLARRWLHAREGRLLAREEARLARRADATLLVSEDEAALLRAHMDDPPTTIRAMGNGIDATFFDPATTAPAAALAEGGPHCVFTGQMDYPPNIAAAQMLAEHILPRIRRALPAAQAHIVGRNPPPALARLNGRGGVRVHGAVPDMRPWLAGADLVTVPLEIARGVQNKVLEAMAMARPVLASTAAARGIGAGEGCLAVVAPDPDRFAAAACAMLADAPARLAMGKAARDFVVRDAGWAAKLAALPELVGLQARVTQVRDAA